MKQKEIGTHPALQCPILITDRTRPYLRLSFFHAPTQPSSRPPVHPPITLNHSPNLLLPNPLPPIRKPAHALEPPPIKTQIRILQQFFLHERTQRAGSRDFGRDEQIGPGLEDFFVQVVDDVVEVKTGEGGDEGSLEAGGDVEDGADYGGHRSLCCGCGRCVSASD